MYDKKKIQIRDRSLVLGKGGLKNGSGGGGKSGFTPTNTGAGGTEQVLAVLEWGATQVFGIFLVFLVES